MQRAHEVIDGDNLVGLLGKSEQDESLKEMLADFKIATPLPRVKTTMMFMLNRKT